jgi:tetratricopeptide (TPR) repeat protein
MKALVSGQAGLAIILGRQPELRSLDGLVRSGGDLANLLRVFDGCADVQQIEVRSVAEADQRVAHAWSVDRALKLFLLLLDPGEPVADIADYADCVEELIADAAVREGLERRMFAAPLPTMVEIIRVESAAENKLEVLSLFQRTLSMQAPIKLVRSAFDQIKATKFGGIDSKNACLNEFIEAGDFKKLVDVLSDAGDFDFLRLQMANKYRRYTDAINDLTNLVRPDGRKKSKSRLVQPEESVEADDDWMVAHVGQNRDAYLQVRAQLSAIVQKLKERDLDSARRFTDELISAQRYNSTPDQIGKSLSNLAQQAKRQEVFELQLEWARRASEENPADPITFGHLADALIGIGHFNDAEEALSAAESAGDACYAATGRARILRALGRLPEARQKFIDAATAFDGLAGAEYAWIGAAETLRDMGRHEEALTEYQSLAERWPLEQSIWSGMASTMMDMGRLEEAILTFGKGRVGGFAAVPLNGRATAYKLAGNFDEALKLYDQVIRDYPNNHVSLCGRAEVLRVQGQLIAALKAYELAAERSPYSPVPLTGKAGVLADLGRFGEATALCEDAIKQFPHDHHLAIGAAIVLKKSGHYDEALRRLDQAIREFPSLPAIQVLRADMLHRLDQSEAALQAYNAILATRPYYGSAVTGKAAVLIALGRTGEAANLLPDVRPKTQTEWSRFILRAHLIALTQNTGAAVRLVKRMWEACPFIQQRRALRSTWAALELGRARPRDARRIVEAAPDDVSNVIAFHVLAASHRSGQARTRYEQIIRSESPAVVIELAHEIARRNKIIDEAPLHSNAWITSAERRWLLVEALG